MNSGGSRRSRWDVPLEPPRLHRWLARHRLVARVICIALALVLVAVIIASIVADDFSWVAAVVLLSWLLTTAQLGWIFPQQVDRWTAESDEDG